MAGTRHDSNQELIGQGVANILSPLFGGIAATGAIARTATNIRNGGTSPLAGVVHGITLLLILLVLAPYAGKVPLAALAAILFLVAWNMSEARRFLRMVRQAPRADVAILLITFVLTIVTDLVVAVNIGVILAMFQFMRRMSASVSVVEHGQASLRHELAEAGLEALPKGVLVYAIEGPFVLRLGGLAGARAVVVAGTAALGTAAAGAGAAGGCHRPQAAGIDHREPASSWRGSAA